jgi:hypothetical protein
VLKGPDQHAPGQLLADEWQRSSAVHPVASPLGFRSAFVCR